MCFIALAGWCLPRATLFGLWLLTDWVHRAVHPLWLALVGLVIVPYTTLTYVLIAHYAGRVDGLAHLIILLVALGADLGVYSKSGPRRAKKD